MDYDEETNGDSQPRATRYVLLLRSIEVSGSRKRMWMLAEDGATTSQNRFIYWTMW